MALPVHYKRTSVVLFFFAPIENPPWPNLRRRFNEINEVGVKLVRRWCPCTRPRRRRRANLRQQWTSWRWLQVTGIPGSVFGPSVVDFRPTCICYSLGFHLEDRSQLRCARSIIVICVSSALDLEALSVLVQDTGSICPCRRTEALSVLVSICPCPAHRPTRLERLDGI